MVQHTPWPQEVRDKYIAEMRKHPEHIAVDTAYRKFAGQHGVGRSTLRRWKKEDGHWMATPRILIYDIETLPNEGYFFECYTDRPIPLTFIKRSGTIITIAYKFLGDTQTKVIKGKPYNDKALLKQFLPIWESAHYTVAHYGDKFDMRYIAARLLQNNLPSLAPVTQIDTYKIARRHFRLNSNKLDYLGEILGVGRKNRTDSTLWVRCAQGDKDAIEEMAKYNMQDVDLLESVFVKLLPHCQTRLNLSLFEGDNVQRCHHCGSDDVELKGYQMNKTTVRHRFRCKNCKSWTTGARK